jgi:hypothetical protein
MKHTKKLTAVVRLDRMNTLDTMLLKYLQCLDGVNRRKCRNHLTPSIPCHHINNAHKSIRCSRKIYGDPVHLAVSGMYSLGGIFSPEHGWFSHMVHPFGGWRPDMIPGDDVPNLGGAIWQNIQWFRICIKKWFQFFLADVSIRFPEHSKERQHTVVNQHLSRMVWTCACGNKGDQVSIHTTPPSEYGSSRDAICMRCRLPPKTPGVFKDGQSKFCWFRLFKLQRVCHSFHDHSIPTTRVYGKMLGYRTKVTRDIGHEQYKRLKCIATYSGQRGVLG